jgi:hypothetical protein
MVDCKNKKLLDNITCKADLALDGFNLYSAKVPTGESRFRQIL